MKKKVLLTGGNGFIGKNIQESFLGEKYEITAPRSFELDLMDTEAVDKFFEDKVFDAVLHAGVKPGHRNAKDPTNLFSSNLRMFENLERNKNKFKKFINFGSGAIYDTSENISNAKETEILKKMPVDEHGFCKYTEYKMIEKLDNFIDLNLFGIFGKYEDYSIRFISNAICKSIFGLPITLRQNRSFSYLFIDDLMPILEFFIENDCSFKSYNIVPDEAADLLAIAEMIKDINGKSEILVANEGYGYDYTGSNERLSKEIQCLTFTKLNESINKLYNYYYGQKEKLDIEQLRKDK